jgi:hypothetical protein
VLYSQVGLIPHGRTGCPDAICSGREYATVARGWSAADFWGAIRAAWPSDSRMLAEHLFDQLHRAGDGALVGAQHLIGRFPIGLAAFRVLQ